MGGKGHIILSLLLGITLSGTNAFSQHSGLRRIDLMNDSEDILAQSQVWNITCVPDNPDRKLPPRTFIATNDGLFLFDGARVRRMYSPQVDALRDLAYDSARGRLYAAGNNGFGWWQDDGYGAMSYHPLETGEYSASLRDFWKVGIAPWGLVYFQSQGRLCMFDPASGAITTIFPQENFRYLHDVDGEIYIQDGETLFRIVADGSLLPVCHTQDRIMKLERCGGKLIAALERTGLMMLDDGSLIPLSAGSNPILAQAKVMSLTAFGKEYMLVGTTGGGLFVTDSLGQIIPAQTLGLPAFDATILSLAEDGNGDIWLGMEAGVARIDCHSNQFYLEDGRLGRVRGISRLEDGTLLIGTNKGAFIGRNNIVDPIPGTTGSVWSTAFLDGVPYIAHDQGLFTLNDGNRPVPLFTETGVMSIARSHTRPDLYICGTYKGLALIRKEESRLRFLSYIEDYSGFCRHILLDSLDHIWIRDSRHGFIRLTLDPSFTKVTDRKDFTLSERESDSVYAIELEGRQLLCHNQEAYRIDPGNGELVRDPEGDRMLARFEKSYGPPSDERNASSPFLLDGGCYATGLVGAIRFSYGAREIKERLCVSQIDILGVGKRGKVPLGSPRADIPFNMNTVLIYLAGNVSGKDVEYRSDSGDGSWHRMHVSAPMQLPSLPFGSHNIEFRIPYSNEAPCTVKLRILRPWYLSNYAFAGYVLLLLFLFLIIREYYRRRVRRENERMRLKADLKARSKELANINFNNAKRNRQLNEIRSMLSDRRAVALIDRFLADESDWEKSEEYFNIIYDGLLEKLKSTYPGISKTDMRICVYTKLNLSTKEIADIMNISVRSVEMARYRLRKRLGLPPGKDIADILKNISQS